MEEKFGTWAQSPSKTETDRCDNAVSAIQNAIAKSDALKGRTIKVFPQGSYRNRTNVRRDSDVDVGVVCSDIFIPDYPASMTRDDFGNVKSDYQYAQFKNEVGQALRDHFGAAAVTPGNKAFDIKETTYHVEADVAPFFEHRRYAADGSYIPGVGMYPDNGVPRRVINWPDQHYDNGLAKNGRTGRGYRRLVRILKSLRNEMHDTGAADVSSITGFLVECLVWNVPDHHMKNDTYTEDLRQALLYLYQQTQSDQPCAEWGEVSELKYLFRPAQKWTRQQANDFILSAWRYVGF